MNLSAEQIRQLRSQLEEEMSDIRHRLDENDAYGLYNSLEESTSELSHYDNHPADIGSEVFERAKDLSLRDADSLRLEEIDDALERMEDGMYGTCAQCGADIPFPRLQANPAAKHCVNCQEEMDEREISANRPVEENFLFPGFGRSFLDHNDEDYNGFDGEDSWQAVARWGTSATNDENPHAMSPDDNYIHADERLGYVEDIEGFLISDIEGNPVVDPQFVRNDAYRRTWNEADELY
jgi:YteA family regulatory protein